MRRAARSYHPGMPPTIGAASSEATSAFRLELQGWIVEPGYEGTYGWVVPKYTFAEIADFTGDHRDDILGVASDLAGEDEIHVFAQRADGGVSQKVATALPNDDWGWSVGTTTGDFNNDGLMDLMLTRLHGVFIMLADRNGAFTPHVHVFDDQLEIEVPGVVADIDRDGNLDVIVQMGDSYEAEGDYAPDPRGRVRIMHGDGEGGLSRPEEIFLFGSDPEDSERALSMEIGDFNNDGLPDLAEQVTMYDYGRQALFHALRIFLHDANRGFRPPYVLHADSYEDTLAAGDFNGDGRGDLAASYYGNNCVIRLYLQQPDGMLSGAALELPDRGQLCRDMDVADLDRNGKDDLLVAMSSWDHVRFYLQLADARFESDITYLSNLQEEMGPTSLAIGDINGDGCRDAVQAVLGEGLAVLYGVGCSFTGLRTGGPAQKLPLAP